MSPYFRLYTRPADHLVTVTASLHVPSRQLHGQLPWPMTSRSFAPADVAA
jgi:hypothetical protein